MTDTGKAAAEKAPEGFFAKLAIWLRAEGRYAALSIIALAIMAVAIWGQDGDRGIAIGALSSIAALMIWFRR